MTEQDYLARSLQQMVDWYGARGGETDELLPPDQQEPQVARAMELLASHRAGPAAPWNHISPEEQVVYGSALRAYFKKVGGK